MSPVSLALRASWRCLLWVPYLALMTVLWIIGAILIPILAYTGQYEERRSKVEAWDYPVKVWKGGWLTWVWGNEEDGIDGDRNGSPAQEWWRSRYVGKPEWLKITVWSAFRNPTNNLRFLPIVNPQLEPERIDYARGTNWAFTWQGVYANLVVFFKVRGTDMRLWLGWKLKPGDIIGTTPDDFRLQGVGFATQLKRTKSRW